MTAEGSLPGGASGRRTTRWLAVAALLVAVVVRVAWLGDKPFWRDEAWVAMVVAERNDHGWALNRPRPVPPGFVALSRLTGALPLSPEIGYRIPALIAGIALLPAMARLAAALGAPAPVPLMVLWIAAGAPALVYYSRELKSYGFDALCATLAPLLALRGFGRGAGARGWSPRAAMAALGVLVAVAPWLTYGGLFAIGATLVWGSIAWWPRADPATRRRWIGVCAALLLSFATAYVTVLRPQTRSTTLTDQWTHANLRRSQQPTSAKLRFATERYLWDSAVFAYAGAWPVLIPLAALGTLAWPRRGRGLLAWTYLAPGALAIAAGLTGRYIIGESRFLLFAAPPLLLAAAAGLATGSRAWRARPHTLAIAAAVGLGLAWSAKAIQHRLPPYRNDLRAYFQYDTIHDVSALMAAADRLLPPDGALFIGLYASKPWAYYDRGRFADATVCLEPCETARAHFERWLAARSQTGWLLLVDDERGFYAAALRQNGRTWREVATERGGALWEIVPPPPVTP